MNVIQNEKQLKITRKLLKEIRVEIDKLNKDTKQHPLAVKALLASHTLMAEELEEQLPLITRQKIPAVILSTKEKSQNCPAF